MEILSIGEIWYPVITLGYGKRLGIWFQGCQKNCMNCISPEFKVKENGKLLHIEDLENNIPQGCIIDGLTISGGEPFDQPQGLLKLVQWFENKYSDDILIFTGYTLEELHKKNSLIIEEVLNIISVLIDGEYIEDLNSGIGLRGSSNQNIYIWKNKDKYKDIEKCARKMQCVFLKDRLWMIGIPPK